MDNEHLVLLGPFHDFLEKLRLHAHRGGVMGEIDDQHLGFGTGLGEGFGQVLEENFRALQNGDRHQSAARDDHAVMMDGIGGRGGQNLVPPVDDRQTQVGQALLGPDNRHGLSVRIDGNPVLSVIPTGNGL